MKIRGSREKCLFCDYWEGEEPGQGTCHLNPIVVSKYCTDWCSFLKIVSPEELVQEWRSHNDRIRPDWISFQEWAKKGEESNIEPRKN